MAIESSSVAVNKLTNTSGSDPNAPEKHAGAFVPHSISAEHLSAPAILLEVADRKPSEGPLLQSIALVRLSGSSRKHSTAIESVALAIQSFSVANDKLPNASASHPIAPGKHAGAFLPHSISARKL